MIPTPQLLRISHSRADDVPPQSYDKILKHEDPIDRARRRVRTGIGFLIMELCKSKNLARFKALEELSRTAKRYPGDFTANEIKRLMRKHLAKDPQKADLIQSVIRMLSHPSRAEIKESDVDWGQLGSEAHLPGLDDVDPFTAGDRS